MIRKLALSGVLTSALVCSGAVANPSVTQAKRADFDQVDAYIGSRMQELGIPGAALVIVRGDSIVHLKAFRVAGGDGRLVTPQTPFFTGSTGKSFTALAIMQLVEEGKIGLDAPVQAYLPWFRVADAGESARITVRQLLKQVSGLPQSIGQTQLASKDLTDSAIENNVRALANIKLSAPPGQRYEYSNANYVTLGMVIQAVSGQSYEAYIKEHIFQLLDMQNSFASKVEARQHGLAVGYQKWFGVPVASPNLPFVRGSLPAGQLSMSAEDLGHYLIAQLNDGSYRGRSVLSPAGIATLHHPDVPMSGSSNSYAMGREVQQFQNVEVVRHNGAVPGYTTDMFLLPDRHIAVAMVMNTYSPMFGVRVSRVPSSVLRMLLGQEVVPGYEFPHMRIIYALVMVIPFLQALAVAITVRRIRRWRKGVRPSLWAQSVRDVAVPAIWSAAVAYVLLVSLPSAFGADSATVMLFQPDVGWVAVVSGVFAIVWGVIGTGSGISMVRETVRLRARAGVPGG